MSIHLAYFFTSIAFVALCLSINIANCRRLGVHLARVLTRPSQVALLYVCVSYAFGSALFSNGLVLSSAYAAEAQLWTINGFLVWAATVATTILWTSKVRAKDLASHQEFKPSETKSTLLAATAAVFSILFYLLDEYVLFVFGLSAFLLAVASSKSLSIYSYPFYLASLAALSIPAINSKRLLIFPVIIAALMLANMGRLSKSVAFSIATLGTLAILFFSVLRGYGGLEVTNASELWNATGNYIRSDYFFSGFGNNTEVNYFYFHGVNSIELFIREDIFVYGETIAKSVLLGMSRLGLEHGLRSGIEIYTTAYAPAFRVIGGSFPISFFSEMFLNFWVFSFVATPFVLFLFDRIFFVLQKLSPATFGLAASFLFLHAFLLLIRGSSFDVFALNLIYSVFGILFARFLFLFRGRRRSKRRHYALEME